MQLGASPERLAEREGRAGKQPDGSARTREIKLAVVFSAERRHPETGRPMRDPGSATASAAIESAAMRDTELSAFAQRVAREAGRRGFHDAGRRVILGDGTRRIWRLANELFPDAIQIVGLFHAKERLWEVAGAVYGPGADRAAARAHQQGHALENGRLDLVRQALQAHDACKTAREALGYVTGHQARMDYPRFCTQGLCVSSGIVEAGCRNVVGQRLKQNGMHWTVRGANPILALRCSVLNRRFEDFWEQRASAA